MEDNPFWRPVAIYEERRQEHKPSVVIKGKVESGYWRSTMPLQVKYGIEDIFIPENTGRAIERLSRTGDGLGVKVVVDRWGNGIARQLMLDGEPYRFDRR